MIDLREEPTADLREPALGTTQSGWLTVLGKKAPAVSAMCRQSAILLLSLGRVPQCSQAFRSDPMPNGGSLVRQKTQALCL